MTHTILDGVTKVKDMVAKLLTAYPRLRDDDNALIANIWHSELMRKGMDSKRIPAATLLHRYTSGALTSAESIRRARQKLQEDFPNLRGASYGRRQTDSKTVKKQIHTV